MLQIVNDNGGSSLVRFRDDDGEEFWGLRERLTTPSRRGSKREIRIIKKYTLGNHVDFLDMLHQHATIRVQLPPQAVPAFTQKYKQLTGKDIEVPSEHASEITPNAKWGISFTVLFPAAFSAVVPPEFEAAPYTDSNPEIFAIYGNSFVWELIASGFQLGRNSSV